MIDWISKEEYAKATKKTPAKVQRLIDEGLLEAKLTDGGGKWMVKVEKNEDVLELLRIVKDLDARVNKLASHLGLKLMEERRLY